ncbi:MAG TPA: CRTAC1 family protein [Planctomycetes bacterium]|nr:CRTAC1 family protein [Planctomycetota bacterium]
MSTRTPVPAAIFFFALLGGGLFAQEPASISFENVSAEAAIAVPTREPFVAFGDFDADGDPDLLVDGRRLFRNDCANGEIHFTDITKEAGIEKARGPGGCWFDFDLDGHLDFGTRSGEVWINDGKGHFIDFTQELGIKLPHGSAASIAWGDLDGDGYLDLFAGGDNTYNPTKHYARACWLNVKRKKPLAKMTKKRDRAKIKPMRDVSKDWGIDGKMYGRAIVFCDFDWDGDDDVYSGNYHLKPNDLFVNDDGKLTNQGAAYGVTGRKDPTMFTIPKTGQKVGYQFGHTIGAAWADLNNDGYFDIWVANLAHKYAGPASERLAKLLKSDIDVRGYLCDDSNLFINQGPPSFHFVDERIDRGIPARPIGPRGVYRGDELWSNAVPADFDNNGWVDVFCNQIYGDAPYSFGVLYMNAAGKFQERHKQAGVEIWGGYGAAAGDIDSDGRLDLVVCGAPKVDGKPGIHVFRNTSPEKDWIGFDLIEVKGRQTVGAKVLLVQEEGVQIRQKATTMGSHSQQNDERIHFGLGSGGPIKGVFIYWPDGRVQSLGVPETGRYHAVRPKGGRKSRLRLLGPETAKVGEEVTFTLKGAPKKALIDWDYEGDRAPEETTEEPRLTTTFEEPGTYMIWARAVRPGRVGAEVHRLLTVTAD